MSDDLRAALEPRTQAGRDTVADMMRSETDPYPMRRATELVLAIEAEAAALATSDGLGLGWALMEEQYREVVTERDRLRAALATSDGLDVERLARALPDVMDQETCDEVMGPGHDPLDLDDEWYMTPRELATQILAALRSTPTP